MSENLERKSTDFVRSLIKFLCIFLPGSWQNFFIAPAGAGAPVDNYLTPTGIGEKHFLALLMLLFNI